ncbi:hypothetical protein PRVXH_000275 [Proteinivorax hydrogeniformans]|uniref:PepSY domain-containing protein n=1 Tax=Proteinivorax hydrogeniformans TaxID=1826727 RepID=A0AAU8HUD0_9FIRM
MFKRSFIFSLVLVLVFSFTAFAAIEMADDEAMERIDGVLQEKFDGEVVTREAWVVDFPAITEDRFYKATFTVDGGEVQGIYVDAKTFEFVDEKVIERYREKENEKGIVRTLTVDSENGEDDEADFDEPQPDEVENPDEPVSSDDEQEESNEPVSADDEDAEVGIISVDEDSEDSQGGFNWVMALVIVVIAAIIGVVVKIRK